MCFIKLLYKNIKGILKNLISWKKKAENLTALMSYELFAAFTLEKNISSDEMLGGAHEGKYISAFFSPTFYFCT